ncbi:MAG: amidase [Planctomycetota bacterium]|jgi:aspartyl-tRNA(Asn)/glutamyl-tRNA(Gln) amidotransferase subunit A
MPQLSADTAFLSVRELAKRLRDGQFSSRELTEFFLERLDRLGPQLNAVTVVTRELAIVEAERADHELADGKDRGLLHGIPYGVKDLFATKDIPTSWGAAIYKDRVIDQDATVVTRLRDAGAVLVAKLAMVEIAGGLGYRQANASFTGPGLNPWDVTRWSGGSSSGSGSAVGGGLVPFALGTETWGSIVTPASFCGVSGLRPTYGRISRHGAMALSWTIDKIGPLCRTADDCGIVLNAIAGRDSLDESSSDRPYEYSRTENTGDQKFRLGVMHGVAGHVQPEVRANYEASLEVLGQFAEFVDIELPDLPWPSVASTIINSESAAAFEGLITTGDIWEMTAEEDRWGLHSATTIPAKDYINAMRIRPKLQRAFDEILKQVDAIVTPTLPTVAYPAEESFSDYRRGFYSTEITSLGGAGNSCGVPALTIPNGFGDLNLPTGLQFVSRAYSENRLLRIADRYQAETDWHTRYPDLPQNT